MSKFYKLFVLFFLLFIANSWAALPMQLGVNLDDNGAFVNMVNHENRFSKATSYDSLGWPKSDFDFVVVDGRPVAEWSNAIDDPEKYRINYSGRYKCSFIGSANVAAGGTSAQIENKQYGAVNNITTFELVIGGYPNANHSFTTLSFTNTKRVSSDKPGTGITKLVINRPGYELNSGKTFTDEFIALCKAANFSCYRYYNLQNIWNAEPTYPNKTSWANRKTRYDATQRPMNSLNGKRDAWSWDYIIELANILEKDIWINIYMSADSNYVVSLAKMLKDSLKPNINIYVENSNEVWSPTQLTHGPYNKAEADANKINFDQNYARRSVELSNYFAQVFGVNEINKRIRVILAGQHAYNGRSDIHLNYIKNNIGEPNKYIYATSTALYFQSTKANNTDPLEINNGMMDDIASQINSSTISTYRKNHINKAKTWGLNGGCTSYEGGPHLPSSGGTTNLNAQIQAHRTMKMGEVTKYNYYEGWEELGGGLAMYFTLNSGYNRYGCWGLTDDYSNPNRNYKMKAVQELTGVQSSIENRNSNLKISYDKANQWLVVENESQSNEVEIELFNTMGVKILTSKEPVLDISSIPTSVYFAKVRLNNSTEIFKFVKE